MMYYLLYLFSGILFANKQGLTSDGQQKFNIIFYIPSSANIRKYFALWIKSVRELVCFNALFYGTPFHFLFASSNILNNNRIVLLSLEF